MAVRAFVIHLERAVQRHASVVALQASAPVAVEIFNAVDGRNLTSEQLDQVYNSVAMFKPPYPFRIGLGEIACFLSHRAVWQKMVDEGIEQALVFEDDVVIRERFSDAFEVARDFVRTQGFVQFSTRPLRGERSILQQSGNVQIVRPHIIPLRTSAQLLGIGAARRLLAASEHFDRPIDALLQMPWQTGQDIHSVIPSGVEDQTEQVGGTTIQFSNRRSIWTKLDRAVKRMRYRSAIARMSRLHRPR